MGLQISHSVYPEGTKKGLVWEHTKIFGASISRTGITTRFYHSGEAYGAKLCTYVDQYSPEVFCGRSGKPMVSITETEALKKQNNMGSFWKGGEYVDSTGQDPASLSRRAILRYSSKVRAV